MEMYETKIAVHREINCVDLDIFNSYDIPHEIDDTEVHVISEHRVNGVAGKDRIGTPCRHRPLLKAEGTMRCRAVGKHKRERWVGC